MHPFILHSYVKERDSRQVSGAEARSCKRSHHLAPHALLAPLPQTLRYKSRPFGYIWAEGSKQADLEAALGVGGFGYPALVAFNPKDAKLSTMRR